jgi:hypothetical protein
MEMEVALMKLVGDGPEASVRLGEPPALRVVGSCQTGSQPLAGFYWRDLDGNGAADAAELVDLGALAPAGTIGTYPSWRGARAPRAPPGQAPLGFRECCRVNGRR